MYQGGYVDQAKESRDISEYAYKRGAASLLDYLDSERTYRANQLAYRQALRQLYDRARTDAPSRGNEDAAMTLRIRNNAACLPREEDIWSSLATCLLSLTLASVATFAGCSSGGSTGESESKMTSYSTNENKEDTASLFTVPQEQMGHLQVVTVQKSRVPRVAPHRSRGLQRFRHHSGLFCDGRPVEKILVDPGQVVHRGQPLLMVDSRTIPLRVPPISIQECFSALR